MARKVTTAVFSTNAALIKLAPRKAPKLTEQEKANRSMFVEKTPDNDAMATLIAEKKRIEAQLREAREADKAARAEKAEARKQARAEPTASKMKTPSRPSLRDGTTTSPGW